MTINAGLCLVIFLVGLFGTAVLFKTPLGFATGIGALLLVMAIGAPLIGFSQAAFQGLDSFPLLAIALFIFSGYIMEFTGISALLIQWIDSFAGRLRGSTGAVTVLASTFFGMLTGSAVSTLSCIGNIMIPEMTKRGYTKSYTGALLAATCFLGILIPPSGPGIIYAQAANAKISAVWMATIVPGILFCVLYITVNYVKRRKVEEKVTEPLQLGPFLGHAGKTTLIAIPALIMPIIVFGGIYGGICTPTEAGAVTCVYGILYYLFRKKVQHIKMRKNLYEIAYTSASLIAVIGIMLAFANCAGRAIAQAGISTMIANLVISNITSKALFLLLVNIAYLFLGMIMDMNAAILIMVPLLMPAVTAMGIDPVHFGAITLVNLSVGLLTPPFAAGVFIASKMCETSFGSIVKDSLPFLAVGLIVIAVTTYCEPLIMWLPGLLG